MELRNLYPAYPQLVLVTHTFSKIITAATTRPRVPMVKNHNFTTRAILIIINNIILEVQLTPTCSAREALHLPTESTDI